MLTLTMSLTVQENKKPYLNFINSLKSNNKINNKVVNSIGNIGNCHSCQYDD